MAMFRKKPVVILARFFDGSLASANRIREWSDNKIDIEVHNNFKDTSSMVFLKVGTLEGTMHAVANTVIIKGVEGEFYPCRKDIFLKTYEPMPDHQDSNNMWKQMEEHHAPRTREDNTDK
jgi:hypothetical protein